MATLAEQFRDLLVPFLAAGSTLIAGLFVVLLTQRVWRTLQKQRRLSLVRRYRPLVNQLLSGETPITSDVVRTLRRRHNAVTSELILAPLAVVNGEYNAHGFALAGQLGLMDVWRRELTDRRWWRSARAALAVGLVRDRQSVPALLALLDHEHEQVRAAAIDALGAIAAPEALAPLVARMKDPTQHERARVVEALRVFGDDATAALVALGDSQPAERALVAAILVDVGSPAAVDSLMNWTREGDAVTRAAAWRAIAAIGPTDRVFYHALKALRDDAAVVRAAAARVLGRTGRADGASYLAPSLDEEWDVAAQAARSLGRLGPHGLAVLRTRADGDAGLGRDLASQVLWEVERA